MPLWLIFHPIGTFTNEADKRALSKDITAMYQSIGLPAFYAIVNFIALPPADIWVGGEQKTDKKFIRIVINHVAYHVPDEDANYKKACGLIDEVLKPHVADRGFDWEYHVDETDRRLWKVNGMIPPAYGSEEEKLWAKENRSVLYDGAY